MLCCLLCTCTRFSLHWSNHLNILKTSNAAIKTSKKKKSQYVEMGREPRPLVSLCSIYIDSSNSFTFLPKFTSERDNLRCWDPWDARAVSVYRPIRLGFAGVFASVWLGHCCPVSHPRCHQRSAHLQSLVLRRDGHGSRSALVAHADGWSSEI